MDGSISTTDPVLVAGAGGFIGGWLVRHLRDSGFTTIRAVDIKPFDEWYQRSEDAENRVEDLRSLEACRSAVDGVAHVYNLACRHGRHGIHRGQPGRLHDLGPDQHPPADGRQGSGRQAALLLLVGLHLQQPISTGR